MQNVRLHVDGSGELWVLAQCTACGEVDKFPLRIAASGPVICRKCGRSMDMSSATNDAFKVAGTKIAGAYLSPVRRALERDGLRGAVLELNQTVPHRYTGIFIAEGSSLRNVALSDKRVAAPELWPPFPLGDSFCSLIVHAGDPLFVNEARVDPRDDVQSHPAGKIVQSYCGVPLLDSEGRVLGTLCHFDEMPSAVDVDMAMMLQVSTLLAPYLPRTP
jgi:GAF domain-containing protein